MKGKTEKFQRFHEFFSIMYVGIFSILIILAFYRYLRNKFSFLSDTPVTYIVFVSTTFLFTRELVNHSLNSFPMLYRYYITRSRKFGRVVMELFLIPLYFLIVLGFIMFLLMGIRIITIDVVSEGKIRAVIGIYCGIAVYLQLCIFVVSHILAVKRKIRISRTKIKMTQS